MITYISKERENKKWCIDCEHCIRNLAFVNIYSCNLYRDNVDGSPRFICSDVRDTEKCNGEKWVLKKKIVVAKNQTEADRLNEEENIEDFMKTAREHVKNGTAPFVTCGYMEKAMERAKKELENEHEY